MDFFSSSIGEFKNFQIIPSVGTHQIIIIQLVAHRHYAVTTLTIQASGTGITSSRRAIKHLLILTIKAKDAVGSTGHHGRLSATGPTNTVTTTFATFNSQFKVQILSIVFVAFGGVTATSPTSNTSSAIYGRVGRVLRTGHANVHNAGEMAMIRFCSVWFSDN